MSQGKRFFNLRVLFFVSIVALGFFAWQSNKASTNAAAGEKEKLSGILSVIEIDYVPGSEKEFSREFLLMDDAGNYSKLILDAKQVEDAGGIIALRGRRIEVEGAMQKTGDGAMAQFAVDSIKRAAADATESLIPPFGNLKYINVLCRFAQTNGDTPKPPSYFTDMVGSTYPGLDHYWRELSYNQMNIEGSATAGWFDLPYTHGHYYNSETGFNFAAFTNDCAQLADPSVYFPDYHGINFMVNRNFGGGILGMGSPGGILTLDGVQRSYALTWDGPDENFPHSQIAHEMGHSIGLHHSSGGYSTPYDSDWDVMSSWRNFVGHPVFDDIGTHTVSGSKDLLGWIPQNRIFVAPWTGANTINISKLHTMATGRNYLMAKVPIPATGGGTVYSVEYRDQIWYDAPVPAKAVVIHKLSGGISTVVDIDGNGDPNDAAAQWTVGETFYDAVNHISISIDSETFNAVNVTIEVNANCPFSLSPTSANFTALGGHGTFDVVTPSGCHWSLTGAGPPNEYSTSGFDIYDAPWGSGVGLAETYPSTIPVSGLSGTVSKVSVGLNKFTHTFPGDLDLILVAPNGEAVMLMSDAGASYDMDDIGLTFDQFAATEVQEYKPNEAGSYLPTDHDPGDTFPAPGPGTNDFNSDLDAVNGINPNGDWKVFAVDDLNGESGFISRIWQLRIWNTPITSEVTSGIGPTTVNYTVTRNYGAARTFYLTVAGQTFTINQAGL